MYSAPIVSIEQLSLGSVQPGQIQNYLLRNISLALKAQELLVLTGSSGSGKTSLLLAIMGYLKQNVCCLSGRVCLNGRTILQPDMDDSHRHRDFLGKTIALVPQNAGSALTPSLRVFRQINESLKLHTVLTSSQRRHRINELLALMGIPEPEQSGKKYPHEFSAGQQQRIAIAMAIAPAPELLLLDEPTSGLDPKNVHELLKLLNKIRQQDQTGMVMVSHDLGVTQHYANRVAILNRGQLEVCDGVASIFTSNIQGTAGQLIKAFNPDIPPIQSPKSDTPLLQCKDLVLSYKKPGVFSVFSSGTRILNKINLEIRQGETVVITGHSGSGKSSVLNCIAGLTHINDGAIQFNNQPLDKLSRRSLAVKRNIQLIFQNSDLSLNPAMTIRKILQAPLQLYFAPPLPEIDQRVSELLDKVHLPQRYLTLKPAQLSGGERQRVAIARACAARPALLLCDEITASLDVMNRNEILALLREMVIRDGCACLVVTHEQQVIRQIAHRIYVMAEGEIISHLSRNDYLLTCQLPARSNTVKNDHKQDILECIA